MPKRKARKRSPRALRTVRCVVMLTPQEEDKIFDWLEQKGREHLTFSDAIRQLIDKGLETHKVVSSR